MNLRINRKPYPESPLRQYVTLARTIGILTAFGILLLFSFPAYGFTTALHIYFEKDGEPYDKPVEGTLTFYGSVPPDDSEPKELYSFHFDCPGFRYWPPWYHVGRDDEWAEMLLDSAKECTLGFLMPCQLTDAIGEARTCYCEGETEGREFVTSSPFSYSSNCSGFSYSSNCSGYCEVTLDIPTSPDFTDAVGGNDGGCFITTLLQQ